MVLITAVKRFPLITLVRGFQIVVRVGDALTTNGWLRK
jgi:hypothetical protein